MTPFGAVWFTYLMLVWNIRLPRAQGEPTNCWSGADRETHAKTGTASSPTDPPHECRRIERSHAIGSGYPAPAATEESPAAVVIGSKSPWSLVHPSPPPGRDPGPMPIVIRSPVDGNRSRYPYLTVAGLIHPAAVLIKVVVTGNFARNITRGLRLIFPPVAREAPLVPAIGSTRGCEVVGSLIAASHDHALARIDWKRLPTAGHVTVPIANRYDCGL